MEISYYADLTASFSLSDDQFLILWSACAGHYDAKVQGLARVGGFMYGHKGSRDFAAQMGYATPVISLTSRELNLLAKALEMSFSVEALKLSTVICNVFFDLQNKTREINEILTNKK